MDKIHFKQFYLCLFFLIFFCTGLSLYSVEPEFTLKQELWNNHGVAVGDIDGDGDFDFLVVFNSPLLHGWYCRVFINDGNANFVDSGQNLGVYPARNAYLGDLDNDGDLDAIISGWTPKVYFNDGTGYFIDSGQSIQPMSEQLEHLAIGDLDNDGDLDFVNSNENPKKLEVFLNDGSGFFESGGLFGFLWTHEVDLADVDNDGDLDVGVSMNWGPTRIYYNNGNAQFTSSIMLGDIAGKHVGPRFADFNNDGLVDLVEGYDQDPRTNRVYFNIGNRQFIDSGQRLGNYRTAHLTVGDIDNDGDIDIIESAGVVYLNDGNGNFTESSSQFYHGETIGLADFDGDSDLDILSYHIFLNNASNININTPPSEPREINVQVDQNQVFFEWGKGSDFQSSNKLLTYNFRIGTSQGANDIFHAEIGPMNTTPSFGNCWYTFEKKLELEDGIYYWSVQSVDPGFLRSNWYPDQKFYVGVIPAEVDIDPDTLNIKSKGKWITAYIELPEGYDVNMINIASIAIVAVDEINLETPIFAEPKPIGIGDYDNDGILDLMVKFDQSVLIQYLTAGDGSITVSGSLNDGTKFSGSDTIRVIH